MNVASNPVAIASPMIVLLLFIRFFISLSFPFFDVLLWLLCCLGSCKRLLVVFISFSPLCRSTGVPAFVLFPCEPAVVICSDNRLTGWTQGYIQKIRHFLN